MRNTVLAIILGAVGFFTLSMIGGFIFMQIVENVLEQEIVNEQVLALPNGEEISLRIADSEPEWVQGLSQVDDLDADEGMLFLFPDEEIRRFWMKDMLISLDIIWIKENKIVGMELWAKPEDPAQTIYYSPEPVDKVLEVNAGFVEEKGLEIGDILDTTTLEE